MCAVSVVFNAAREMYNYNCVNAHLQIFGLQNWLNIYQSREGGDEATASAKTFETELFSHGSALAGQFGFTWMQRIFLRVMDWAVSGWDRCHHLRRGSKTNESPDDLNLQLWDQGYLVVGPDAQRLQLCCPCSSDC